MRKPIPLIKPGNGFIAFVKKLGLNLGRMVMLVTDEFSDHEKIEGSFVKTSELGCTNMHPVD